jgi:hypothetical protein
MNVETRTAVHTAILTESRPCAASVLRYARATSDARAIARTVIDLSSERRQNAQRNQLLGHIRTIGLGMDRAVVHPSLGARH